MGGWKRISGNVLPLFRDYRPHNIEVLMGRDLFVTEKTDEIRIF